MKNTLIMEILKEYSKMDDEAKIRILQQLENSNAKYYNRPARKIIYKKDAQEELCGLYDPQKPDIITINRLDIHPLMSTLSLGRDGYRAAIDDYLNNRSDLYAEGRVNAEKLIFQESNMEYMLEFWKTDNKLPLAKLSLYKEQLARKEAPLHLIHDLIDACQNESDCYAQSHTYLDIINNYYQDKLLQEMSNKLLDNDIEELEDAILILNAFFPFSKILNINNLLIDNNAPTINNIFDNAQGHIVDYITADSPEEKHSATTKLGNDFVNTAMDMLEE